MISLLLLHFQSHPESRTGPFGPIAVPARKLKPALVLNKLFET